MDQGHVRVVVKTYPAAQFRRSDIAAMYHTVRFAAMFPLPVNPMKHTASAVKRL